MGTYDPRALAPADTYAVFRCAGMVPDGRDDILLVLFVVMYWKQYLGHR